MDMHYATNAKNLAAGIPICGHMGVNDEISIYPRLCTCLECLDWIRPDHDSQASDRDEQ